MKNLQNTSIQWAIEPQAIVNNAAFTTNVIDTTEAGYAEFITRIGAIDIALSTFKVMGSDVKTDAHTLGGTPTLVLDAATKPSATDDNHTWVIGVDLTKPVPRYLQLQATVGNGSTGAYVSSVCLLDRLNEADSSATGRGVTDAEYV